MDNQTLVYTTLNATNASNPIMYARQINIIPDPEAKLRYRSQMVSCMAGAQPRSRRLLQPDLIACSVCSHWQMPVVRAWMDAVGRPCARETSAQHLRIVTSHALYVFQRLECAAAA